MLARKEFTLYKRKQSVGLVWYAKFWNEEIGKYSKTRSTGILAEGKKQRKAEAYEEAKALLFQGRVFPAKKAENTMLFIDYCCWFWTTESSYMREAALVKKRPHSLGYVKNMAGAIRLHVIPYQKLNTVPLNELTAGMIRDWQLWALENGRSGRRVNVALQAMRVPIRYLIEREELSRDPFAHVGNAAALEKEKGILTFAERSQISALAGTSPHGHLAVLLGLLCGMRLGEIRGLQWGDIDGGLIRIRNNWQDGEGLKIPKCGSFRSVPTVDAIDKAFEAVRKIALHTEPESLVFERISSKNYAHGGGIEGEERTPYSRKFFSRALESELSLIGIPGAWHGKPKDKPKDYVNKQKERYLTFHGLRHTCFTLALLEGATVLETKTIAGWKDARMMARYTNHVSQVIDYSASRKRLEKGLKRVQ